MTAAPSLNQPTQNPLEDTSQQKLSPPPVVWQKGMAKEPNTKTVASPCDLRRQVPGAYNPATLSKHNVAAIDCTKYHLHRRTHDPINFRFLSKDEADSIRHDPQYLEYDTLVGTSPYCARVTREEPDIPIDVPENFIARTVNMFTQLVSPTHATSLPTHYLWTSGKSVPGVYDHFGAIRPEKIPWTIGTLLGLHTFARLMQVHFICNMVLDRIHWMFIAQVKM
jgi:hypothetical protein